MFVICSDPGCSALAAKRFIIKTIMTLLFLMPILLYWCFVKSMDEWNWRFYVAASVFVFVDSGISWVLGSAYTGHWDLPALGTFGLHLAIALPLFYALERYGDSDDAILWPLLFCLGVFVVFLW